MLYARPANVISQPKAGTTSPAPAIELAVYA
jgi:hypothetical protein